MYLESADGCMQHIHPTLALVCKGDRDGIQEEGKSTLAVSCTHLEYLHRTEKPC